MYLLAAEVDTATEFQEIMNSMVTSVHDILDKVGSVLLGSAKETWDGITEFFGFVEVLAEIPDLLINYLWSPLGLCVGLVSGIAVTKLVMGVLT